MFFRAGTIAASAINPHLDLKKTKPLQAADIFPNLPQPKPDRADKLERAESFFSVHNANVLRLERRKKAG